MMPLSFAEPGKTLLIQRVGGNSRIRAHLKDLGFVAGAQVAVVSANAGNLIVRVKASRVAISCELASKILV